MKRARMISMTREHTPASGAKGDHIERLGTHAWDFHPGRSGWHSANRKPGHSLRTRRDKPRYIRDRHMPFEDQAIDDGGVTGSKVRWHAETVIEAAPHGVIDDANIPVQLSPQLSRPFLAAATPRVTVNDDIRCNRGRRCSHEQDRDDQSFRHTSPFAL